MAKSNKMGMTSAQLNASRSARFASNAAARSERVAKEMEEDGSAKVFDQLQAGEITKEQAVQKIKEIWA